VKRTGMLMLMALAGLGTAPLASADSFDFSRPSESLFASPPAVILWPGAANAIARTEMISGTQSISLTFIIPVGVAAGTVSVTLADLNWPGAMSSLSFAATTSTSLLAQLAAPGAMNFDVSGPGEYFATVYGVADPALGSGLYSLNLSYSPVPLPAAAWLMASGLLLLRARRGKETVINAR